MKRFLTTISFLFLLSLAACQKDYNCVCTTIPGNRDTLVDHAKTTRLGAKYYKKTCEDFDVQNSNLKDCQLQ